MKREQLVERTAQLFRGGLSNASAQELLDVYALNLLMGTGVQVVLGDEILRRLQGPTRSLELVLAEATEWANETFGYATQESRSAHLSREAQELAQSPNDPDEMADVAMLLGHLAAHAQVDLVAACQRKLAANRARQWGEPDEQGVVEHVREVAGG